MSVLVAWSSSRARESARDRPIDMCSRLSALVCPRAEDGKCVCVFRQVFKTRGYSGRHHRTQDPCSSALPDRYRSKWAAPDGSMVARTLGVMAAEKHLKQPSPKRTRSEQPVSQKVWESGCGAMYKQANKQARLLPCTIQTRNHNRVPTVGSTVGYSQIIWAQGARPRAGSRVHATFTRPGSAALLCLRAPCCPRAAGHHSPGQRSRPCSCMHSLPPRTSRQRLGLFI